MTPELVARVAATAIFWVYLVVLFRRGVILWRLGRRRDTR